DPGVAVHIATVVQMLHRLRDDVGAFGIHEQSFALVGTRGNQVDRGAERDAVEAKAMAGRWLWPVRAGVHVVEHKRGRWRDASSLCPLLACGSGALGAAMWERRSRRRESRR